MIKKILFFIIILVSISFSQRIGDVSTPYATVGWDSLYGYTIYYRLPVYRLLSNPGGWININQRMVDSLFNELIVLTDSLEYIIRNDTLISTPRAMGRASFVTTGTSIDVTVDSMKSTDYVQVTALGATITSNDVLSVVVGTNKFTVYRPAAGTSGLSFMWEWRRKR